MTQIVADGGFWSSAIFEEVDRSLKLELNFAGPVDLHLSRHKIFEVGYLVHKATPNWRLHRTLTLFFRKRLRLLDLLVGFAQVAPQHCLESSSQLTSVCSRPRLRRCVDRGCGWNHDRWRLDLVDRACLQQIM